VAIPITTKAEAERYLEALERSHDVGRIAFRREFSVWWDQAGRQERLAMVDLLSGETDSPRCTSLAARHTARVALMALNDQAAELRERYVRRRFELPDDRA
jgi:hypothetical protein